MDYGIRTLIMGLAFSALMMGLTMSNSLYKTFRGSTHGMGKKRIEDQTPRLETQPTPATDSSDRSLMLFTFLMVTAFIAVVVIICLYLIYMQIRADNRPRPAEPPFVISRRLSADSGRCYCRTLQRYSRRRDCQCSLNLHSWTPRPFTLLPDPSTLTETSLQTSGIIQERHLLSAGTRRPPTNVPAVPVYAFDEND